MSDLKDDLAALRIDRTADERLLIQGLVWSLLMGLIGGLLPAVRAARLPVATALREL